jgi:hypothetical protein
MQTDMDDLEGTGRSETVDAPIDDHTYNVIQALSATLQAVEVYGKCQEGDGSGLFQRLREGQLRHADELHEELRTRLSTTRSAFMTSGPHRPVR